MFIRNLFKRNFSLNKPQNNFFVSRNYLFGIQLDNFRKDWTTLTDKERMTIASNQSLPACSDVLISKGDASREEKKFDLAIRYYQEAIAMDKSCESVAQNRINSIQQNQAIQPNSCFALNSRKSRYIHTSTKDESFNKLWSKMSETSRKIAAINTSFPENAEVLIYRGHSYREMGEYYHAVASYREAMEMDLKYSEKANQEIQEVESLIKRVSPK